MILSSRLLRLLVASCAIALATAGPTPAANPAGPLPAAERARVERLGATLVAAINAPNDSTRRRLIGEAYAPEAMTAPGIERIAAQLASIRERFPGLEFHKSELSEMEMGGEMSRVLHVYARQPSATGWRDIQVRVSPNPPHRLTQVVFIAEVTEPIALPNGDIAHATTIAWLNDYVDRLAAEHDLAGSFLVAVGEKVVCERFFGYADAARKKPIGPKTLFNLASASKMFTALACARLVEDGKLSYSSTIDRYFPDFPDSAFARRATVGHLLSHTSGVGEYWTAATDSALQRVRTTAEILPMVYGAGIRFQPGTRFEYSNSNFILAGLIVEKVSGRSFEEFTAGLITRSLDLDDTGPFATADTTRPLAQPLQRAPKGWAPARRGVRGTAAGGWYSTPRDMLAFLRALKGGHIVSRSALDTMLVSRTRSLKESDTDYGYGFILQRGGGVDSYGHGGTAPGVNAEVRAFPAPDVTFVIFSNQDTGAYDDLRKNITRLITGER